MNVTNAPAGQDMGLSAALMELSKNGILVLAYGQSPAPGFKVALSNRRAQELITGLAKPLTGTFVEQLPAPFNTPTLTKHLHEFRRQGTPASFQLLHPYADSVSIYDCQLVNVDSQQLVFSFDLLPDTPGRSQWLEQVIETMPTGLAVFRAIRDDSQTIVDFQAVLCNQSGADMLRQRKEAILSQPVSQRYSHAQAYELVHRYVTVVATGEPCSQLLHVPTLDIWLDMLVVRYEDGVLVSFQDVTPGQQTASLLESVMKSSPASVRYYESIRDQTGRIIDFMTSTGNELAAYRPYRPIESTTGRRLLELYPFLKENGTFDRYIAVVESGQSDHYEQFHQTETRKVWFDCRAVRHGNGFVLTTLDITEQKEAQLAEQRQAVVLQTVLDNSLTGVAWMKPVYGSAGQITDFILEKINATLAQTLRQPPQAVEGKPLSQLLPHHLHNGLFDRYVTVVQTGESQRFDWSNSKGTAWYDLSAVACSDGLIVTFMDITAMKMTQLEQIRQADLINGVLQSTASSILVLDPLLDETGQIIDFRISLGNPATTRLFKPFLGRTFTEEEILAQTMLTLFPAGKERSIFTALTTVVTTGQAIHQPVDYPQLGLTYEYDITPFRGGVLMLTTDITPLRVYQQQLEANNIALSRSNEYLQQFAYVASHDLQEPLRKIQSFSDLLLTQYAETLDEMGQDLLRRQQNAALRMQILVKDLLSYSRLTTQQTPFRPVSLQAVTQDVLSDLETIIRDTNAQVTIADLPTIPGDETQFRQLIQNLLTNALKFTKPGQPPQIRLTAVSLPADQLPKPRHTLEKGPWLALSVTDEGIGFDASQRERIFELFQRLHGRSQYTGTGIGLAVVKKVVENHRGQITVDSQPGAGTTFTVYLPMV